MSYYSRFRINDNTVEIEKSSLEELADAIVEMEDQYCGEARIAIAKQIPIGFWSSCCWDYTRDFGTYLENARIKKATKTPSSKAKNITIRTKSVNVRETIIECFDNVKDIKYHWDESTDNDSTTYIVTITHQMPDVLLNEVHNKGYIEAYTALNSKLNNMDIDYKVVVENVNRT